MSRTMRKAGRFGVVALAVAALAACSSSAVVRTSPQGGARHASARAASVPKPGATVVVQRGDTLFSIARRNNIQPADLAAWNGLGEPYTIYPGQSLRLYPGSGAARTAPSSTSAPKSAPSSAGAPPPAAVPAAPASSGFPWRWPAGGALVGQFVPGEATKQGIDIAGSSGQQVRAAADGVVVYSGNGLVGYGELVIIKHNEQWLSAYGHNRKRLVNEGQNVKAGQPIAEMGRSGATRDMLHFEIRYNGRPVDPLLYLPKP